MRGRAGRCRSGTVVDGPYFRISKEPITAALRRAAATKFAGPEPGGGTEIVCLQLRNLTLLLWED